MAVDVLVTGASGVLGRQVVLRLRAAGRNVVACGRAGGSEVDARWDVTKQDTPQPNCKPSVVVHAAARLGSYQQPLSEAIPLFETNVEGTLRVARWCISVEVQTLILISSAIVYGEWKNAAKSEEDPVQPWLAGPYAVSKWCSEQVAPLVRSAGIGLTILRLSSLYGIGYAGGLIPQLLRSGQRNGSIPLDPPYNDAFDLLHVSDAASTILCAMDGNRTGIWNLGGGALTTIRDVAETCAKQFNVRVNLSNSASSRGPRIINWVDDEKARGHLGHKNRVTLDLGISEIAQSMT